MCVLSGEAWKDAWRTVNDKFEYEARKTAERIDREYKVSQKVNSAVRAAQDKAREIDCEYEVSQKWRGFVLDFSRYWPRDLKNQRTQAAEYFEDSYTNGRQKQLMKGKKAKDQR
ncbi:hypothetical protein QQ045_000068 [Rhodiola kirilowii]